MMCCGNVGGLREDEFQRLELEMLMFTRVDIDACDGVES
jgi:hypothetical protein